MSNLPVKTLLKEIDNLSREEKIQLIHYLTRQIENKEPKTESENLVELFQNSPLVGVDIDLERQKVLVLQLQQLICLT
ncbi:hypothetical protein H6G64_03470 [Calothrix sp. FACHB-156]|nr:hypothetical protein [Calothrix sp. FACHB-156]